MLTFCNAYGGYRICYTNTTFFLRNSRDPPQRRNTPPLNLYICICFQASIFIFVSISGNDAIHYLTQTDQEIRVDLADFAGDKVYALYSTFDVGDESSKYQLTVSGYSGTAGKCTSHLSRPCQKGSLSH
jgi:hypothetical protein